MNFLKVFILGIVEGMTEFLPVSSTGHLILFHQWFQLSPESFQNAFDVIIQLGAILSVVVLYYRRLNPLSKYNENGAIKTKYERAMGWNLWVKVIVGVIPAGVLGFLFDDFIDEHLFSPYVVAVMLIFWGAIIIIMESKTKRKIKYETTKDIPLKTAFLIGLFQCLAMVPGTSRSAATIIGAIALGTGRVAAAEFSFYLAIPTMIGATLLKMVKNAGGFTLSQWFYIFLGGLISFITAILVIRKFMDYIKKHDFKAFGVYRIIIGFFVLVYFAIVK
ncbi:MAG: undecaprenyl-diphosphate phosphatase [Tissierellia bacterium]|nr:undecaprenyl-diphosphate phosphatase [Tissierellia bacterium]